jgi:hypothetical protein
MTADVTNAYESQEAIISIFHFDEDSLHEKVAELTTQVQSGKIDVDWQFQYKGNTMEILTEEELSQHDRHYQPIKYFFTVTIDRREFGTGQESGFTEFRDWIEIKLLNCTDKDSYVLTLPDGSKRNGKFTSDGILKEDDTCPGKYYIEIQTEQT